MAAQLADSLDYHSLVGGGAVCAKGRGGVSQCTEFALSGFDIQRISDPLASPVAGQTGAQKPDSVMTTTILGIAVRIVRRYTAPCNQELPA